MIQEQKDLEKKLTTVQNPSDPLEVAWADYAVKFISWQGFKEKYQNASATDGHEAAECKEARLEAQEALWRYFEVYDADQVARFGPNEVKIRV